MPALPTLGAAAATTNAISPAAAPPSTALASLLLISTTPSSRRAPRQSSRRKRTPMREPRPTWSVRCLTWRNRALGVRHDREAALLGIGPADGGRAHPRRRRRGSPGGRSAAEHRLRPHGRPGLEPGAVH